MVSKKKRVGLLSLLLLVICFSTAKAQLEESEASNSIFYYTGLLGGTDKVEFNIQLSGYKVTGSCILVESGDFYIIKGRLSADKSGVGLLIYNELNIFIASIEAKLISEELDFATEIRGVWKPENGLSKTSLTLFKVAELASINDHSQIKVFF